jgi:hypothetical protein
MDIRPVPTGYGAAVREPASGSADGGLGTAGDPVDEQPLRTDIDHVRCPACAALVVTAAGEIDLSTLEQFRAALTDGFDQLARGEILVVDLTKVTFISSTGLQA